MHVAVLKRSMATSIQASQFSPEGTFICHTRSLRTPLHQILSGESAHCQQMKDHGSSTEPKAIIIVGRLKDFDSRNWRPSVYVDETELARSQNGRFFVAKVDPGKRTVRAEYPKHSLRMDLKPGDCYFFRVEIASGFAKAYGRLVGLTSEQGAAGSEAANPDRS